MSAKPILTEVKNTAINDPSRPEHGLSRLVTELRKRKVCRAAVSYVLVLWLNLQIGDVIFPLIGLPDWSLSLIIIIGVMGFPIVLLLAWVFQVTPAGIVVDQDAAGQQAADLLLDRAISLLLLLCSIVLSVLLLLQFLTESRTPLVSLIAEEDPQGYIVSALEFQPTSDETSSLELARGVHDELMHRLINVRGIELLPENTLPSSEDQRRRLALSGSLRVEGPTAHILAHLVDLSAGRYLMSTTFNLEVEPEIDLGGRVAEPIMREVRKALFPDAEALAAGPESRSTRADHLVKDGRTRVRVEG